MVLSFTTGNLRHKLGNTIGENYEESMLNQAVAYGISQVCRFSRTTPAYWVDTNPYWGSAVGIGLEFAVSWCRSTQVNVSIQMMREWQKSKEDAEGLYTSLLAEGLIKVGTSFFTSDEFQTDVLNPVTGTRVTGLYGIQRSRRLNWSEVLYDP